MFWNSSTNVLAGTKTLLKNFSISPLTLALSICLGLCVLLRRRVNESVKLVQNHGAFHFLNRLRRWEAEPFCPLS